MRTQVTRTIAGRIAANGTIISGTGDFTVQPSGTGVYIIRLPKTFRLIAATASTSTGITNRSVDLLLSAAGELVANLFVCTTATNESNVFSFVAVGTA